MMYNLKPDAYPLLLIDESISRSNIRRMTRKIRSHGLVFRPHFKTHQSLKTAEWFRNEGITAITVSSVKMAQKFAGSGWKDITIAFPLSMNEIEPIVRLSETVDLSVVVDMPDQAAALSAALSREVKFLIKVDTGYGRAGVRPGETAAIDAILRHTNNPLLKFNGFLTHTGETYHAGSEKEIIAMHRQSSALLVGLKQTYMGRFPGIIASAGDTPSASVADDFSGLDEFRPGNFVYYDLMQWQLGSCRFDDIAVAVICPVVSVYPERDEALLHCGAVHLSKEFVANPDGTPNFGLIVPFKDDKWLPPEGDDHLNRLSQEHGIFTTRSEWARRLKPGDLIAVIPVHSCLTVDLLQSMA